VGPSRVSPPPVLENKGFAARSAVSSCKYLSYRQSPLSKGVRWNFFGWGGGMGGEMGKKSTTNRTDHRSNHLQGIRVVSGCCL
jgi:hypothetical protein